MTHECDYLILGAGLTGLAAANVLGNRAVVLERDERPGGLVKAECFDGYWFDHVIHVLYFADPKTESRIRTLLGDVLQPCPPEAWVETSAGTVRFPFQMHLGGLEPSVVVRCLRDLAEVTFNPTSEPPANYEDLLLRSFGRGMCETFLLPYNRKTWKRPLDTLAPAGFTWNITPPDFEQVLRGALNGDREFRAYNAAGWYPRPPAGSEVRGMEVLARALAGQAKDVRLEHRVTRIDAVERRVVAHTSRGQQRFAYRGGCLCTLPLPLAVQMCADAPADLVEAVSGLTRNRVLSVALRIEGPRPEGRGHWRYYGDESLCFTRLVYMCAFDPLMAPPEGWSLLAELIEPAEEPPAHEEDIIERCRADLVRAGGLPDGCEILGANVLLIDPAYVVFTPENEAIVKAAQAFLAEHGITALGRYGRWEYSSMAQVMRDGFAWADAQTE